MLPCEPPTEEPIITSWRNNDKWLGGRLVINPHSSYYSQEGAHEKRVNISHNALRILKKQIPLNLVCQ